MKLASILVVLVLVVVVALRVPSASAHELTPEQLGALTFEQRLGEQVPLDLGFRDQDGNTVALSRYISGPRAIILTLNYFHCQNLCPVELEGLASALNGVTFTLGDDFDIVSVSIDPHEGPSDAAATRLRALRGYDRRERGFGWHMLTGDQTTIERLAAAVGFSYTYDADANEYAHPLGVMVLTPTGQVSRYLFGLDYAANDLRLALVDASNARIGSLIDRAALLCYHYDPLSGRYTPLALNLLRGGGASGVAVIALFLGWLWRAELRAGRSRVSR